jgi:hypothetical protein
MSGSRQKLYGLGFWVIYFIAWFVLGEILMRLFAEEHGRLIIGVVMFPLPFFVLIVMSAIVEWRHKRSNSN